MIISVNTYHLIVTNCTARKRGGQASLRWGSEFVGKDLATTVRQWRMALAGHEPKLLAREMYMGRSMVDAKYVADTLNSPLHIVSAGMGLIAGTDEVAPYDLTPSGSRGGLQETLSHFEVSSTQWWDLLCGGKGLTSLLARHPESVLLVALPANYVEMLAHDLSQLPQDAVRRARFFTSQPGADALPDGLASMVMPYDNRLESVPNYAGTRSDFPQRAMRHFVEFLGAHKLPQDEARAAVNEALAPYQPPCLIERQRADDATIKELIRKQWRATGGRGNALLRYLRDDARISCEQGRFAQLWREVSNDLTHLMLGR